MIKSIMARFAHVALLLLPVLVLLAAAGCQRSGSAAGKPAIAVTTSYLECVARDVLGDDAKLLCLAEPGACPGHFDIRPSQAAELRHCRTMLRFDFQSTLDSILAGEGTNRTQIVAVAVGDGLCQPDTYLAACRQVARALVEGGWLAQTNADAKLGTLAARLKALAGVATNRVALAGLTGTPVIASAHQKEFCEWLGLKVVASFRAADTTSVAEIDRAVSQGKLAEVKLVIANLPEGHRAADALAARLKAKVVVFGNFPAAENGRASFDGLVMGNVNELVEGAGQ